LDKKIEKRTRGRWWFFHDGCHNHDKEPIGSYLHDKKYRVDYCTICGHMKAYELKQFKEGMFKGQGFCEKICKCEGVD